ncbi:HupE/UreJ family protein [Spirosoma montaniterrae]|nr:HupE/UreJ family protein [Spirosoma montaniterrae]
MLCAATFVFYYSLFTFHLSAHPMPNSVVLMTVHPNRIDAEVQIPLIELQAAYGHVLNDHSTELVARLGPQLRAYLAQHIRPQTIDGQPWAVSIGALTVQETQNAVNGVYRELTAQVQLYPPAGANVRQFVFYYDVVLHQVVTHKILVAVRQDWAGGMMPHDSSTSVGVIELDIPTETIKPLTVNFEPGSLWTGFRTLFNLGVHHISEGTDHLLFLLVLLLPAPLLTETEPGKAKRWGSFGGIRYGLLRLLVIVTAFTFGHSLTLLAGAVGWVSLPSQPVEILIALSIFVSALHALRPLFPEQEGWIAAGFGLVHGLAFAGTLTKLQLDAGPMALSILGFNLGIEAMQLFVICLTLPWFMLLSRTVVYAPVRVGGAVLAGVAALAWVVERFTGVENVLTLYIEQLAAYPFYLLTVLILVATGSLLWTHIRTQRV